MLTLDSDSVSVEQEMAKGGKLAALMETVKSLGLDLEKLKTQLEIKGKGIAEDEDKVKSVQDSIKEVSQHPRHISPRSNS